MGGGTCVEGGLPFGFAVGEEDCSHVLRMAAALERFYDLGAAEVSHFCC